MVHSAHQPAAADAVRDVLDAGPRGGGRRGVVRHQRPAGDGLERDASHENAAEDVSPTRAARDGLFERVFDERAVARAFVEPITEIFRPAHPISSRSAMPWRYFLKCTSIARS